LLDRVPDDSVTLDLGAACHPLLDANVSTH